MQLLPRQSLFRRYAAKSSSSVDDERLHDGHEAHGRQRAHLHDCHKGEPNFLRTRPFQGAVGKKLEGLQVLKGMPSARITQVMTAFTKALGVECAYCHTDDFDEDTPRKQIARFC
jgi:hypothetical protein